MQNYLKVHPRPKKEGREVSAALRPARRSPILPFFFALETTTYIEQAARKYCFGGIGHE